MWAPGIWELGIILVMVLVVFGPGKLPGLGRALGSTITEFKDTMKGVTGDDDDKKKEDTAAASTDTPTDTSTQDKDK